MLGKFRDIVLTKNYYYLYEEYNGLFKKNSLDKSEPKELLKFDGNNSYYSRTIKIGLKGDVLVMSKNRKAIILAELDKYGNLKKTIEFQNKFGNVFDEHQIFGKNEDAVAILTKDGWLVLYKFDIETGKVEILDRLKIDLNQDNEESPFTLAIHEGIFAIALIDSRKVITRLMIYEKESKIIEFKAELDLTEESLPYVRAMKVQGLFGNKLILTAVTCSNPTSVLNFSYDVRKKTLNELRGLRRVINAGNIVKLERDGDNGFLTTDHSGKIVRISFVE